MLLPEGTLTGAAVQVSLRNLGKCRADTTAGLLLGAAGVCAPRQVAAEDAARHSSEWEEGFCISPF